MAQQDLGLRRTAIPVIGKEPGQRHPYFPFRPGRQIDLAGHGGHRPMRREPPKTVVGMAFRRQRALVEKRAPTLDRRQVGTLDVRSQPAPRRTFPPVGHGLVPDSFGRQARQEVLRAGKLRHARFHQYGRLRTVQGEVSVTGGRPPAPLRFGRNVVDPRNGHGRGHRVGPRVANAEREEHQRQRAGGRVARDERAEGLQGDLTRQLGVAITNLHRGKTPGVAQAGDRFESGGTFELQQSPGLLSALAPRMDGKERARGSGRKGLGPVVLKPQVLQRAIASDLEGRSAQPAQGHAQRRGQLALVGDAGRRGRLAHAPESPEDN